MHIMPLPLNIKHAFFCCDGTTEEHTFMDFNSSFPLFIIFLLFSHHSQAPCTPWMPLLLQSKDVDKQNNLLLKERYTNIER